MSPSLQDIVAPRIDDDELHRRVAALYEEVDREVAARSPICTNRGACCKFAEYGHRLYVTSVELAYFAGGHADDWRMPDGGGACPYQRGGVCTAREHRPLGCRVFFCDAASANWQGPLYEEFLARLQRLGEDLGVEYRYVEWLSALSEITPPDRPTGSYRPAAFPEEPPPGPDPGATGVDPGGDRLIQLHVVAGGNRQPARAD